MCVQLFTKYNTCGCNAIILLHCELNQNPLYVLFCEMYQVEEQFLDAPCGKHFQEYRLTQASRLSSGMPLLRIVQPPHGLVAPPLNQPFAPMYPTASQAPNGPIVHQGLPLAPPQPIAAAQPQPMGLLPQVNQVQPIVPQNQHINAQGYTNHGNTNQGSGPAIQGYANQGHFNQGYVVQGRVDLGQPNQGHANQGPVNQGYTNQGHINQSHANQGQGSVAATTPVHDQDLHADDSAPQIQNVDADTKPEPLDTGEVRMMLPGQHNRGPSLFQPMRPGPGDNNYTQPHERAGPQGQAMIQRQMPPAPMMPPMPAIPQVQVTHRANMPYQGSVLGPNRSRNRSASIGQMMPQGPVSQAQGVPLQIRSRTQLGGHTGQHHGQQAVVQVGQMQPLMGPMEPAMRASRQFTPLDVPKSPSKQHKVSETDKSAQQVDQRMFGDPGLHLAQPAARGNGATEVGNMESPPAKTVMHSTFVESPLSALLRKNKHPQASTSSLPRASGPSSILLKECKNKTPTAQQQQGMSTTPPRKRSLAMMAGADVDDVDDGSPLKQKVKRRNLGKEKVRVEKEKLADKKNKVAAEPEPLGSQLQQELQHGPVVPDNSGREAEIPTSSSDPVEAPIMSNEEFTRLIESFDWEASMNGDDAEKK